MDLVALGVDLERDALLARWLPAFDAVLATFIARGFTEFTARWDDLDLYRGQTVSLSAGPRRRGQVLGIAADGSLRLRDAAGEFRVVAGELSLRGRGAD